MIVKGVVKACDRMVMVWPWMLPYVLWQDHTTRSSKDGYMPMELMARQAPIMPTENAIATWTALPWKEEMSREELQGI